MQKVWVIGHVAEDVVLKLNTEIVRGNFHLPTEVIHRCGGSTSNIAIGIASGPIETGFITYLGNDDSAKLVEPILQSSNFNPLLITRGEQGTPRCLVIVDISGERTLMLLSKPIKDHGGLTLKNSGIKSGDIVLFTHWWEEWRTEIDIAREQGCTIVIGLGALLADPEVSADIAIGSIADIPKELPFEHYLDRFPLIVVTRGLAGSTIYSKSGKIHQEAFPVNTIDTTGAGDSFLAGFLTGYALGITPGKVLLEIGARWASSMVTIDASIPPNFYKIDKIQDLIHRALKESK